MSIENPNIDPMLCHEGSKELLNQINFDYAVQSKLDGHRAIMVVKGGKNYFYSRRTSKETGEKENNTSKLPYLHNLDFRELLSDNEYIFDGELTIKGKDTDSSKVQHILGSTPERAGKLWREGYELVYNIFDVIKWDGEDVTKLLYIERARLLASFADKLNSLPVFMNISVVPVIFHTRFQRDLGDNYLFKFANATLDSLYKRSLLDGYEGIVIKKVDSIYEFKRSKNWLKFKEHKTADLVVLGYVDPDKAYTGKFTKEELKERNWLYWEDEEPVSKTYALGYKAGIRLGAKKGNRFVYVTTVKGFSDAIQEQIKISPSIGKVVEVEYQEVINQDKKSLRHPRFLWFREDKEANDCLWDNIL